MINTIATPELVPRLDIASALPIIPAGLTFVVTWSPGSCNSMFCNLIKKHWGMPSVTVFANLNPVSPASATIGGSLSRVYLMYASQRKKKENEEEKEKKEKRRQK